MLGWSDLDAFVVRYPFTAKQMETAQREWNGYGAPSIELRTGIHERVHLASALSTWGGLTRQLREVQAILVTTSIDDLRSRGRAVRPPIFEQMMGRDGTDLGRFSAALWFYIERTLAREENSVDHVMAVADNDIGALFPVHLSPEVVFRLCAGLLAGDDSVGDLALLLQNHAPHAVEVEQRQELLAQALKVALGDAQSTIGVQESLALASEYLYSPHEQIRQLASSQGDRESGPYLTPLWRTAQSVGLDEPSDTLFTHIVCCDAALMPPVVLLDRRPGVTPELPQILPGIRLMEIQMALGRLSLPAFSQEDPEGTEEAMRKIFADLDWVSPDSSAHRWRVASGGQPAQTRHERMMRVAAQFRFAKKPILWNPGMFLRAPKELLPYIFQIDYPIIQFDDRTFYHKDKEYVEEIELEYGWGRWLRQLFLFGDGPIELPWRATRGLTQDLAEACSMRMSVAIDMPNAPMPQFVPLRS